jgi:hypothetical protein
MLSPHTPTKESTMEGIFNSSSHQLGGERGVQRLRSRRLMLLGYDPNQAAALATTNVDIDQMERLIGLGCPHDLAIRIAL